MGLGFTDRSALGVFKRSALGVKGDCAPTGPGSIILAYVYDPPNPPRNRRTLAYSPSLGTWGFLAAAGSINPQLMAFAGGQLYGRVSNTCYRYDGPTDAWVSIGVFASPIAAMCEHNGQIVVSQPWAAWTWNGTAWAQILTYTGPGMVHPSVGVEQTIECVNPPGINPVDCVSEQQDLNGLGTGITSLISVNGRLYAGGSLWNDWTIPASPSLNAHPIIDNTGAVIAIFSGAIRTFRAGPPGQFFVEFGGTTAPSWRSAWPGCCTSNYNNSGVHYTMITGAQPCQWVAVNAAAAFAPGNVVDFFGTMSLASTQFLRDVKYGNGQTYGLVETLSPTVEEVLITTDAAHGLTTADSITISNSHRYNQSFATYPVTAVPSTTTLRIARQFRGTETCQWARSGGGASGNIVSFADATPGRRSGVYRWTGTDWTPAWTDRNHPEGLPGPYPMFGQDGPGYFRSRDPNTRFNFDISEGGDVYLHTEGQGSDADAFERVNMATGIGRRLCFPEAQFPLYDQNGPYFILAGPPGAAVGSLPNTCPGDSVTSKFASPSNHSIFTFSTPHGLTEADSVDILTSTEASYIGTWAVSRIVNSNEVRLPVAFVQTATGTWQQTGNPGNNGNFTAVRSGDGWVVYIDLGTDPRPGDLRVDGNSSTTYVDMTGVPYDREKVNTTAPVTGVDMTIEREVRYDRIGPLNGPGTTHFIRLEYFDPANPGWILGEAVTVSRP